MSNSDSKDDNLDFQSAVNLDAQKEEKKVMMQNDQNFKILLEICDSFYDNLQKCDYFGHKSAWRTYSDKEPIKLKIESVETLPGICDIIKPENRNFYHKVLTAFGSIILEVDKLLTNIGTTNYESLYGLSVYGEEIDTGEVEKSNTDEEIQISRMLSYFNEILHKIYNLLTIAINLLSQLVSLYGEQNNKHYQTSYKLYTFDLPFDYLGKILSYFLAIDTIVSGNEFLNNNWDKYRIMLHKCKNNSSEFNMNDVPKKKLDKLIKKLNATIFDHTCYNQSLKIILKKSEEILSKNMGINTIAQSSVFLRHFTKYITSKTTIIYSNLDELTESYEPIQLFQYLSLFGLYLRLCGNNNSNILKDVWHFQKKIVSIHLVGISYFNIKNFLNSFEEFNGISGEPSNVEKHAKSELNTLEKQLPFIMNNFNHKILKWTTKIDTLFNDSTTFSKNKYSNIESLIEYGNKKAKLIIKGLCLANYLRKKVSNILETHLNYNIPLSTNVINSLTTGFELIKVIESEFRKLMHFIGLNLNIINRALLAPIQNILKKVAEKAQKMLRDGKSLNWQLYKDVLSATSIFSTCSQAVQSELRLVIEKLCLSTINAQDMLEKGNYDLININLWKLELINQLSREIRRCCDCSFLYLYQNIFPISFKLIYDDRPKRLYFFMMAINDIEKPLHYIKYKQNNGIDLIKLLRKKTFETFEDSFLKILSKEIESDLRELVHINIIEGLELSYSDKNLKSYLKIKSFILFDKVIDIKRYIEEHLNMVFYKLTTLNLCNWEICQQMRTLAKHKYGLNLHDAFLPYGNLEQGKDIFEIIRNFSKFTKNYVHNMHNQIFIEIQKESLFINIIGVRQIINSLYRHGKGIINSILNQTFGYISKEVIVLLEIIFDDYISILLKGEKSFWESNKGNLKYNYPLYRGKDLLQKILFLDENKKNNLITKTIQCITQIGNAVALVRCVRTALMDYNSKNENFLTSYKINDFNNLIHQISLQVELKPKNSNSHISSSMLGNILNSFYDSNKIFGEAINSLKQTGENELNFLEVLVKSFAGSFSPEKIHDIDLFAFLLPPLILTFIDTSIQSRDNLQKNESGENSYFSNDGFMMGVCYLLKVFDADKQFESLNWFPSVIAEYENQLNKLKSNEISQTSNTMDIKQINCCLEQFKLQYFTYTSASFLFTDLDTIYKSGHLKLNELENKNKSRDLKLNELEKNNKSKHLKLNKLDKYLNY